MQGLDCPPIVMQI